MLLQLMHDLFMIAVRLAKHVDRLQQNELLDSSMRLNHIFDEGRNKKPPKLWKVAAVFARKTHVGRLFVASYIRLICRYGSNKLPLMQYSNVL